MDDQRQRIVEDLSGVFAGEIACDALSVAMFASDASWYQIEPLGVAFPANREDVITLAKYSAENKIPLFPRGAGSSVTGGSLGRGLIVDCSRHLTKIEQIGPDTVRVEAGVVLDDLNRLLRGQGRYFPPDPSNPTITTIGSMLAIDAAGSRSMRVGSTRDHVRSIEVVLSGGQCVEFGNEPLENEVPSKEVAKSAVESLLSDPLAAVTDGVSALAATLLGGIDSSGKASGAEIRRGLVSRLARILSEAEQLIQEKQPAIPRNCSGYFLRGILSRTHLNAARLLIGSEGTLGIFTAAILHTAPLPTGRGVALLIFKSLESAIDAVHALSDQLPSACDLLDRRLLTLARESDAFFSHVIPPTAEAALIVEQTGFSETQARDRIRAAVDTAKRFDGHLEADAYDYDSAELLWSLPRKVVPHLNRVKGAVRPQPFVEGIAVPPNKLREFLARMQRVLQKHEVIASLYSHAASGQIHLRPFLPPPTPHDGPRIESLARDLYQAVFEVGGTISGEHGDGLSRTSFLRSQYGPLYRVFQQVKELFDPQHLMNPGKIVSDDPHLTVKNLRPSLLAEAKPGDPRLALDSGSVFVAGHPIPPLVELHLQFKPDELLAQAATCNGCGLCRTQSPDLRMCPFFRVNSVEEASPRAKANIVRNYLTGHLSSHEFASPEMKRIADLCFNCKQCELECPSNVNVSQMMIEAKAANVAEHGLDRANWILSRAHSLSAIGCWLSWFANRSMNNAVFRWLLEHTLRIHRRRKLPTFARKPLLDSLPRELTETPQGFDKVRPIVYFVDHFANYHDPELGRAFLAILKHNGLQVHVPQDQIGSGMAMISAGDLDAARKVAEKNVRELSELAREGVPIVCTEPAAALCLMHEYPRLLDHPDVQVVADQVVEATAFLAGLLAKGQLKTDFGPLKLSAAYHTPCHLKALHHNRPVLKLLEQIPELEVFSIEKGCSGMAGAFGLTRDNFDMSLRIGHDLIEHMRVTDVNIGLTECSSCKMQMEQDSTTPTLHPLKLLALSYGLMPEIQQRLQKTTKKLVVT